MRRFDPHDVDRRRDLDGRPLAPFGRRAAAFGVDLVGVSLLFVVWRTLWEWWAVHGGAMFKAGFRLGGLGFLVTSTLYFGLLTWLGHGQSPGKRVFGLRVLSLSHAHLSLWHSVERALGYAASALEAGFGFAQYFIHPNRQTVHDRIAETIVVDDRAEARAPVPAEAAPDAGVGHA